MNEKMISLKKYIESKRDEISEFYRKKIERINEKETLEESQHRFYIDGQCDLLSQIIEICDKRGRY